MDNKCKQKILCAHYFLFCYRDFSFAKNTLYDEVEDIMGDQSIISKDINGELESNSSYIILSAA